MITRLLQRLRGERGSVSAEAAIVVPTFLVACGVMLVIFARTASADDRIAGVADNAARAASLARSAPLAVAAADASARTALADGGLHCIDVTVNVDTSGFAAPIGTPGIVRVTVTCTVNFGDISVPGLPGSHTLTDSADSPLNPAIASGAQLSQKPARATFDEQEV